MTETTPGVIAEPFASDTDFWTSVRASGDALILLVVAAVVTAILGGWWALLFVVPVLFLLRAAVTGRASARRSQAAFDNRDDWRIAERQAVAKAFVPAVLRRR